jgi:outer membrane protein assembly factor BamB
VRPELACTYRPLRRVHHPSRSAIVDSAAMVYWRRSMGGWFSAPVIRSDGTIYVCWSVSLPSSSTNLTALNATTGSVWWTYQIGGPASQAMPFTPALSPDGSTLYLSCGMRLLCAITASWATSVWNASLLPDNVWTSILLDSGRIFFGTDQGRVCAFAASNGAQTWCKVLSAAQAITTTPMIAVGGSLLYWTADLEFHTDFIRICNIIQPRNGVRSGFERRDCGTG